MIGSPKLFTVVEFFLNFGRLFPSDLDKARSAHSPARRARGSCCAHKTQGDGNDRSPERRAHEFYRFAHLRHARRGAAPARGAKVLRVGLVHRGRVIDERILTGREALTIGPNENSMFVVPAPGIPPNHRLFERADDHYRLHLIAGMSARIATSAG